MTDSTNRSLLGTATRISVVTLGSRILGFVRDVVMFRILGFGWAMGTFTVAWMIPNLLRRLFGEGALSASFIPAYTRAKKQDGPTAARHLLSTVTGLLLLLLGTLTAVVLTICFFLPGEWIGHDGAEVSAHCQGELLLELTIILFPYAIPICMAAIFAGALNTYGTFALPAAAPIVLNVFWLSGLGFAWYLNTDGASDIVRLVAVFLLAGGVAQMLLSLIPLSRRGHLGRPRLPTAGDLTSNNAGTSAGTVVRNIGPTVIGMSLVQINTMMDQGFALYLIDSDAPSFVYAANRLLLFPHALTSLAVATAVFPRFSELGTSGDLTGLRKNVDQAMHHTLLVALPATLGMMLVARPLIDVMFGDSDVIAAEDLGTAAVTTVCLVASLPTIGIAQLHARALYALGDYRTPAWISFWLLLLNVVLNIVFVLGLEMGVAGLALATTLASVVNAIALRRKVTRTCSREEATTHRFTPMLLSCVVMGAAVYGTLQLFDASSRTGTILFDLLIPIAVGMATYGVLVYGFGQRRLRMR